MKASVSNVLVGVVLLAIGYSAREPGETVVLTRVDTIPYAAFRDSLNAQRLEADGLRAKLAGRGRLAPRVITRTDTLVSPPDTVLQVLNLTGRTLSLGTLTTRDSLWAPEIHRFDVGDCDDGYSWSAGELVCDRARFGHLSVLLSAGLSSDPREINPRPEVYGGLAWSPSNQSPWRSFAVMDRTGRLSLGAERSFGIF